MLLKRLDLERIEEHWQNLYVQVLVNLGVRQVRVPCGDFLFVWSNVWSEILDDYLPLFHEVSFPHLLLLCVHYLIYRIEEE